MIRWRIYGEQEGLESMVGYFRATPHFQMPQPVLPSMHIPSFPQSIIPPHFVLMDRRMQEAKVYSARTL
jgi:hypothetical protein